MYLSLVGLTQNHNTRLGQKLLSRQLLGQFKNVEHLTVCIISRDTIDRHFLAIYTLALVNQHNFALLAKAFVLESERNWLHAVMAQCFAITFFSIDVLRPQTIVTVVAIACANIVVDNYPCFAVGTAEAAGIVFALPFFFFIRLCVVFIFKNIATCESLVTVFHRK